MRTSAIVCVLALALTGCGATRAASAPAPSKPAAQATGDPLRPAAGATPLPKDPRPLDVTYTYDGQQHTLADFLTRAKSNGFVVLDGATIVDEQYSDATAATRFQSWSMAKSFTATAVGIALSEGHIDSIDDPVTKYLPQLKGSGYDGVSIRNVLRMSSGIAWNEDSDAPRLQVAASRGQDLTKIAARQVRGWTPGSKFDYNSLNYFVLGWLVSTATGQPYYRYVESEIWKPAGMSSTASVGNDTHGHNLGYCCYYATDRDFARLGLTYLNGGGDVVPHSWVTRSTTASSTVQPGYGLGWWVNGTSGDYMAAGFGGQYIYVSPKYNVVIVESSVKGGTSARAMQKEALTAFRATAAEVARTR